MLALSGPSSSKSLVRRGTIQSYWVAISYSKMSALLHHEKTKIPSLLLHYQAPYFQKSLLIELVQKQTYFEPWHSFIMYGPIVMLIESWTSSISLQKEVNINACEILIMQTPPTQDPKTWDNSCCNFHILTNRRFNRLLYTFNFSLCGSPSLN